MYQNDGDGLVELKRYHRDRAKIGEVEPLSVGRQENIASKPP